MTAEHGQSNVPTTTAIPKISSSESASLKKNQDTYPKKQGTTLVRSHAFGQRGSLTPCSNKTIKQFY